MEYSWGPLRFGAFTQIFLRIGNRVQTQGEFCNLWPSNFLKCSGPQVPVGYLCHCSEGACVAELAGALRWKGRGDHYLSLFECLTSLFLVQISLLYYNTYSGCLTSEWTPKVLHASSCMCILFHSACVRKAYNIRSILCMGTSNCFTDPTLENGSSLYFPPHFGEFSA